MGYSKQNNTRSKLNQRQKAFCREYVKTGNGRQSAIKAGYAEHTADITACKLLKNSKIAEEITRVNMKKEEKSIMTAAEVMQMFTDIAQGKIKDQFGLDASLNDRLKALQELAKRTVDIDNRLKGVPDSTVTIKLNWEE